MGAWQQGPPFPPTSPVLRIRQILIPMHPRKDASELGEKCRYQTSLWGLLVLSLNGKVVADAWSLRGVGFRWFSLVPMKKRDANPVPSCTELYLSSQDIDTTEPEPVNLTDVCRGALLNSLPRQLCILCDIGGTMSLHHLH